MKTSPLCETSDVSNKITIINNQDEEECDGAIEDVSVTSFLIKTHDDKSIDEPIGCHVSFIWELSLF